MIGRKRRNWEWAAEVEIGWGALERVIHYARQYVRNLPNLLCDAVTKRFTNLRGFAADGNPRYAEDLHYGDQFRVALAFAAGVQQERISSARKKATTAQSKVGQSVSAGEFGSDMTVVLGANVDSQLKWERWESFAGHREAVFSYSVKLGQSRYRLFFCCYSTTGLDRVEESFNAAIRGWIYFDPETGVISRLVIQAMDLPSTVHIQEDNTIIHYGQVGIGGREYVLPVRATMFARAGLQKNRNEIAFVRYRKFDPDSVITDVDSKIRYQFP